MPSDDGNRAPCPGAPLAAFAALEISSTTRISPGLQVSAHDETRKGSYLVQELLAALELLDVALQPRVGRLVPRQLSLQHRRRLRGQQGGRLLVVECRTSALATLCRACSASSTAINCTVRKEGS